MILNNNNINWDQYFTCRLPPQVKKTGAHEVKNFQERISGRGAGISFADILPRFPIVPTSSKKDSATFMFEQRKEQLYWLQYFLCLFCDFFGKTQLVKIGKDTHTDVRYFQHVTHKPRIIKIYLEQFSFFSYLNIPVFNFPLHSSKKKYTSILRTDLTLSPPQSEVEITEPTK